jgi:hypothetical protein
MKGRFMLIVILFLAAAGAAFYCNYRLGQIAPMADAGAVVKTDAVITQVYTPMVKKNETTSEVVNQITFAFTVDGKEIIGGYELRDRNKAPELGTKEPVVYLAADPAVFLRAGEYEDLPRQLTALKVMRVLFGIAALGLPLLMRRRG